ncbi:hypothetical protein BSLG_004038 [Batrachochytrium salamandrivorans]|nr:hypothetical protein BSLG_004038 [Batrachochytrium salamandrivorans]
MPLHSSKMKLVTLVASCFVMATGICLPIRSTLPTYEQLGFSSANINLISGIGNTAVYISFFSSRASMTDEGYHHHAYMAVVGVNMINFPSQKSGITLGILLLFYGLSATIYSQIFAAYYSSGSKGPTQLDTSYFLLSLTVVNIVGCLTIFPASSAHHGTIHCTGAIADLIQTRLALDPSLVLVVSQILLFVSHAVVAFFGDELGGVGAENVESTGLLYFCSACIGLGWGSAGACFLLPSEISSGLLSMARRVG